MKKYSGFFPWDDFYIDINGRKLYLGRLKEIQDKNDFIIGFIPYTTEDKLRNINLTKNMLVCIGDFNSYLYDVGKYGNNIIHISTYAFHPFDKFYFENKEVIHDGIIVARNDGDKNRDYLSDMHKYKLISCSNDGKIMQPHGFNFFKAGKFEREEIRQMYNSSLCSFMLSHREGECRSVMESLLCGCPVISTKPKKWTDYNTIFNTLPMNGGRAEILTPKNSIYCDWNPSSVRSAYETLVNNIDKFDRLAISQDAHNFIFRSRVSLLKIIHHVVKNVFNSDIKEVINNTKGSDFYNMFENEIKYYVGEICE